MPSTSAEDAEEAKELRLPQTARPSLDTQVSHLLVSSAERRSADVERVEFTSCLGMRMEHDLSRWKMSSTSGTIPGTLRMICHEMSIFLRLG